ncbi:unnamed protein product [Caenorhabditis auriculariae]|uniref:WD repeat domain phosphoinositide-interacting protein 4 n=1 Tax=Caenorhabditis auriculariae TaxID=2777116 RepID=A0A8S1GWB5_9PELO|nr:unnamed protein product [Caenorhabditis auriculariae]
MSINHAAMNAQNDSFCIASEAGVKVFHSSPPVLSREIKAELVGNARLCCVLHRSNVVAFVGGGRGTNYPSNTAMVWDDDAKKVALEYTVPGGPILNLLMTPNRLIIVQDKKIHFFMFPDGNKPIRFEDTRFNPHGLAAVSIDELTGQQLAFPGFKIGSVRIMNLNSLNEFETLAPTTINAHLTEIAQIAMNNQGTLLATGSTKGTVIRVFETRTQRLLVELRRGNVQASLHCLSFSPCSTFLAASSDKGTIHVFRIRDTEESSQRQVLRQVGLVKGAADVAKISLEPRVLCCGFTNATSTSLQSLVVICANGTYHRYSFNADGHTQRESFESLKQLGDEQDFWTSIF